MEYRFKRDLAHDDNAYAVLCDKLDDILKEKGIPTKAGREMRTKTGLIVLEPFPYKGNASAEKKIAEIPGLIRVKKGKRSLEDGTDIIMISAHVSGLAMLKQIIGPEDSIIFYDEEAVDRKETIMNL